MLRSIQYDWASWEVIKNDWEGVFPTHEAADIQISLSALHYLEGCTLIRRK